MKKLTELHNKYINKPIWIAGSDASLDTYPDSFFDDKIGITLHLAYEKFPNATYRYFNEYDRLNHLIDKHPKIKNQKCIFGWPFYQRLEEVCEELTKDFKSVWYLNRESYPPNGDPCDIFLDDGIIAMQDMVKTAKEGKSNTYGGHGTCLHPCLYAAVLMGGNPINIIGSNHEAVNNLEHFSKVNSVDAKMRPNTPTFSSYRGNRMKRGTQAIIDGAKKINITINWIKQYDE